MSFYRIIKRFPTPTKLCKINSKQHWTSSIMREECIFAEYNKLQKKSLKTIHWDQYTCIIIINKQKIRDSETCTIAIAIKKETNMSIYIYIYINVYITLSSQNFLFRIAFGVSSCWGHLRTGCCQLHSKVLAGQLDQYQ